MKNNLTLLIEKYLKPLYFISLGLFWISLAIYLRFFRYRPSYKLNDLQELVTIQYLLIHFSFIVFHAGLIFYTIYSLLNKNNNENKNFIIQKITLILEILLKKPLEYLKDLIAPHIPYSGVFFCKFGSYLAKRNYALITKTFVIIFAVVPRIIVALVFFVELIFFNHIYYFIPCLLLLIIPVIWNIFINLFITFAMRALKDIPTFVEVIPEGAPLENGWHTTYSFKAFEKYEYGPNDIKEYASMWSLAIHMYSFGYTYFKSFKIQINPYVILICSSFYISATIYKVIFLISFFS